MGSASRGRNKKGEIMTISKERKAELTAKFGKNAQDTGNSKVQVAILSERIKELTEHMKSHQKDFHTRRAIAALCSSSVVTYRPVGTLHLDIRSTGGFPVEGESRPWGVHPAAVTRKVKS